MKRGNSTSISVSDPSLRRKHCVDSVDRISDLPDSIIAHILSFLPIENAMASCILSQRWKFLWTEIGSLDFYCRPSQVDQFIDFVNYVLILHKPEYLNSFSLSCMGCTSFYVNIWIVAAISRNVCELILSLDGRFKLSLHVQRSMFSCESLRSLDLCGNICIPHEIGCSLPKLESLKLIAVCFQSEETLCNLLGGCPVLKYLFLRFNLSDTKEKCHLDDEIAFRCIISSTSLRRLELYAIDGKMDPINVPGCSVHLDAPSLVYMKLFNISSISIQQSLIFLVEAYVHLVSLEPEYEDQNHYKSVVDAFHACNRAETLAITPKVITAFSFAFVTVQMKTAFNKLTRLEVTKDWIYWRSLHRFLTLSDNLQVFKVEKEFDTHTGYLDCSEENITLLEPNIVPRCLSNSLRKVAINDYDGNEDEFRMAGYILKHGSVLERMKISLRVDDLETMPQLIQKISELPKKSPVCEVKFSNALIEESSV